MNQSRPPKQPQSHHSSPPIRSPNFLNPPPKSTSISTPSTAQTATIPSQHRHFNRLNPSPKQPIQLQFHHQIPAFNLPFQTPQIQPRFEHPNAPNSSPKTAYFHLPKPSLYHPYSTQKPPKPPLILAKSNPILAQSNRPEPPQQTAQFELLQQPQSATHNRLPKPSSTASKIRQNQSQSKQQGRNFGAPASSLSREAVSLDQFRSARSKRRASAPPRCELFCFDVSIYALMMAECCCCWIIDDDDGC